MYRHLRFDVCRPEYCPAICPPRGGTLVTEVARCPFKLLALRTLQDMHKWTTIMVLVSLFDSLLVLLAAD